MALLQPLTDSAEISADRSLGRRRIVAAIPFGSCWKRRDDPDELGTYMPETHDCSARQQPPAGQVEMIVYCEDCAETRPSYRERVAAKLEADDRLGILFACGAFEYVDESDPSEADGPWRGPVYQRYGPLECDCGAEIHSIE